MSYSQPGSGASAPFNQATAGQPRDEPAANGLAAAVILSQQLQRQGCNGRERNMPLPETKSPRGPHWRAS